MVTRTFCLAHIKEADRLAALCVPGAERDSFQRSADHWRIVLHMNEIKELNRPLGWDTAWPGQNKKRTL